MRLFRLRAVDGIGRPPPVAEHSPTKSLEPGQLPLSPAALAPVPAAAQNPAAVKAEPADVGLVGALPPGFSGSGFGGSGFGASPDRQSSDTDLATDGPQADGALAPKRRRLGWGQGLARLRGSPDAAPRKQKTAPDAAEDAAAADDELPAAQQAAGDAQAPDGGAAASMQPPTPAENGHAETAEAAQPVDMPVDGVAEPVAAQPQETLPSKLELMTTMERVHFFKSLPDVVKS